MLKGRVNNYYNKKLKVFKEATNKACAASIKKWIEEDLLDYNKVKKIETQDTMNMIEEIKARIENFI